LRSFASEVARADASNSVQTLNFDASEGHYATDTEFVTGQLSLAGAKMLAQRGAAPLEIDSVNIVDDTTKGRRPAHTILLEARIPSLKTSLAYGKRGGCADLAEHGFRRSVAGSANEH
jgi:hypothetical protein